jgi:hypothetical protein
VLLLAQEAGVLQLGTLSLDGTKVHADASKHKADRDIRLLEVEAQLRTEVEELFALSEESDQSERPDGLVVRQEIARREDRRARKAVAKAVLEARAAERTAAEQAEYEEKMAKRAEREQTTGRRPGGRPPTPPRPAPREGDQYNFTDPDSRIMKNPTNTGFEQDYNAQVAVDQASLLIVGCALSNHPNDTRGGPNPPLRPFPPPSVLKRRQPSMPAIVVPQLWPLVPNAASSLTSPQVVIPIIQARQQRFAPLSDPPPEDASPQVKMAYKLKTALGKAIYGARKCTVEPVIGMIKEVLGFRQFSLRGISEAFGEWGLVCLAFNLKRFPTLS